MAQQPCNLRLSGHVEDADTKDKLVAATVRLIETGQAITTDEKGDFVFHNLCGAAYTLVISHVDCDSIVQRIILQRDQHFDFLLPHARNTLAEVVVESRTQASPTGFREQLSGRRLEETRGQSLSEALNRINGVTMLQTGTTVSKPVIHGLHGNRILTINNGVRQEGQQWGNEHAPEIDPFIADKLTVIKGVDEVRYGSDAIGGVVLVQPRALRTEPGYVAEFNAGYFTNNRQYVASLLWEQQPKAAPAFTYRIHATLKRAANAATPDYRLNNTAQAERNFSVAGIWRRKDFNTELFYSLFSVKAGIFTGSHIGNLSDLQQAIAADRPDPVFTGDDSYTIGRPYQDVVHQLVKSKTQLIRNGHRFNLQLAAQLNSRKEFDIIRGSSDRPQLNLTISTLSEELTWDHRPLGSFKGTLGVTAMQQDNAYAGRYFIPNYRSYSFGAFGLEKWTRHAWELQAGARIDHKTVKTYRMLENSDSSFANNDFDFTTFALSGNVIHHFSEHLHSNLMIALSRRAPHVNELLSNGIHHGTATYEEGDPELVAEQGLNLSFGLNYESTVFDAEVVVYSNTVRDFIYQQPVPGEPVLTISGAFPLIRYMQTDARLSGVDISTTTRFSSALEWTNRGSLLRARNRKLKDWLIFMPSDRFSSELVFKLPARKFLKDAYVSAEVQHIFRQSRVPDETTGKQDYKAAPAAYTLVGLNASAGIQAGQRVITVSAGVRNLFDIRYRDYMNMFRYFSDDMGRNIHLRLQVPLSINKG